MEYEKIKSSNTIKDSLRGFDDCYPRLANRIKDIDSFTKKLADNGIVITCKDSYGIKGVICFYANDNENCIGFITILWINKANRSEGIGTKLLNYSIANMKHLGMKAVRLEVKKDNIKAISFYKKNSFVIEDTENNDSFYMIRML